MEIAERQKSGQNRALAVPKSSPGSGRWDLGVEGNFDDILPGGPRLPISDPNGEEIDARSVRTSETSHHRVHHRRKRFGDPANFGLVRNIPISPSTRRIRSPKQAWHA